MYPMERHSAVIWEMIACPSESVERERHSSFSGMDMLSFPKKRQYAYSGDKESLFSLVIEG